MSTPVKCVVLGGPPRKSFPITNTIHIGFCQQFQFRRASSHRSRCLSKQNKNLFMVQAAKSNVRHAFLFLFPNVSTSCFTPRPRSHSRPRASKPAVHRAHERKSTAKRHPHSHNAHRRKKRFSHERRKHTVSFWTLDIKGLPVRLRMETPPSCLGRLGYKHSRNRSSRTVTFAKLADVYIFERDPGEPVNEPLTADRSEVGFFASSPPTSCTPVQRTNSFRE